MSLWLSGHNHTTSVRPSAQDVAANTIQLTYLSGLS